MTPEQSDTNAAIWKSADVAKGFAELSQQRERQRAEQLTLVARLLGFEPRASFSVLDLGAGTGAAARAVLDEYPNASALLADYSEQMMAEGDRAMAAYAGRYRFVEFDMLAGRWPDDLPLPLDAAVSALSIHHLPDQRKQSIFRELFERLRPGAWYINYDPVRAPTDALEDVWQQINDRYDPEAAHKRTHRTPQGKSVV